MSPRLDSADLGNYQSDGFLYRRALFDADEIDLLRRSAKEDKRLDDHSFGRNDGEGGTVRLSLWNHPGDGIYGAFARCERIVDTAEQLLGDEPYHYHSKMIMKDARVGGAWAWHQDYGYWYGNGVLTPNLLSVFIAVDPSTRLNGCLQVIRGSHLCGRVEHRLTGEQAGADPERVEHILKRMEHLHIEMEPGDALFFHSNLLHRSDQNRSDSPRWAMVCCYNAKSNDPYKDSHHPRYTPLDRLEDDAIRQIGARRFTETDPDKLSSDEVGFLDPNRDASAKSLEAGQQ
ncbi:phytanoyl-CoA dioxygenase family protein [Roseiconus lacunae]|uniref:Phytanoyl-CoA dioxygenase family protein n=1 Tax=Roseiconus lacunae TaxID=2605694 RepID=A0ABT7PG82_9BACT|nr:phytanoyl-CoA dioxygenase family protein [Roseiconus lacunae]MCD0460471.1 phytanoyl-CoA dioxygenase family protein [Roseiconus lacunae]MDM4015482.1 phytanoyl-CoA dioxygenase family protein [Roseiconus lacunae]WRQ52841.1 phytanoyl-CoA dioxygenase family protein [Stieleria sp. HD01]